MTIACLGSCNIDHVLRVPHLVNAGETVASATYQRQTGGKGLNQSVALARSGARVTHLGCIGPDGAMLRECLVAEGIDGRHLQTVDTPTGNAFIQVDDAGENAIVITPGANACATPDRFAAVIADLAADDWLLVQNETPDAGRAIALAAEQGVRIAANPAPMTTAVASWPLDRLDLLIVNRYEAATLACISRQAPGDELLTALTNECAAAMIVLTDGADGAWLRYGTAHVHHPARLVTAVDTVAAGDVFTGFFLGALSQGRSPEQALDLAIAAAGIAVTRPGAARSIPHRHEITD
jgi:ribokinase